VVPAVAVGDADGPHLFPQALVLPVDVEAGGVGVQGPYRKGKGPAGLPGHLQEHLGDPGGVEGVQHPAHAVVVEEVGGDAGTQEVLGGLALEEVAEEVEGGGDEAQGVQEGGLEGHPGGDLFPGPRAHEAVHGLHQPDSVQHAGHQAQVAQVVDL
jgi:hypothetical protein